MAVASNELVTMFSSYLLAGGMEGVRRKLAVGVG